MFEFIYLLLNLSKKNMKKINEKLDEKKFEENNWKINEK